MGILPLQFLDGDGPDSLGLHGGETFTIKDLETINSGKAPVTVRADSKMFKMKPRLDTPREVAYYRQGWIMQYVLRSILQREVPERSDPE
jgi:aconitate hydratase